MWAKDLDKIVFEYMVVCLVEGKKISVRKIAKELNMNNSLRSIQLSFQRLIEQWKIERDKKWEIELVFKDNL